MTRAEADQVEECRRAMVRAVHVLQRIGSAIGHAPATCDCGVCQSAREIAVATHVLSLEVRAALRATA